MIVPMCDWACYLHQYFQNVLNLKNKYHHFTFLAESSVVVSLKEYSDSPCRTFTILSDVEWCPEADDLPPLINPVGLPLTRPMYLYEQIREFCREGTEDLVCPKPLALCKNDTPDVSTENADRHDVAPCSKRVRRCGKCGDQGHTRRNCKEN